MSRVGNLLNSIVTKEEAKNIEQGTTEIDKYLREIALKNTKDNYIEVKTDVTYSGKYIASNGSLGAYDGFITLEKEVKAGDIYYLDIPDGFDGGGAYAIGLYNGNKLIKVMEKATEMKIYFNNYRIEIPTNCTKLRVSAKVSKPILKIKVGKNDSNKYEGRRICWLGTSVSEGIIKHGQATEEPYSYLKKLAKDLGCTIYNNALSGSPIRIGQTSLVTESNPYGLAKNYNAVLGLSGTTIEKQAFIDNWDSKVKANVNNVALNATLKNKILNSSYEVRLSPWLNDSNRCDLYVIEHGINDALHYGATGYTDESTTDIYDRMTYRGAMNYLIKLIKEDNIDNKILLFGHYENTKAGVVALTQEKIAERWGIPIIKTWRGTGWNTAELKTTKHWVNGHFIETEPSTETSMTLINIALPDGLHPCADASGKANLTMTNVALQGFKELDIFRD